MSMEPCEKQDGNPAKRNNYKELLIGSGNAKVKILSRLDIKGWNNLVTLDINPDVNPDILTNLEELPYSWAKDNEYDEIHAYEVLEHIGKQGDYKFFFDQFNEFGRILKPNGFFFMSFPKYNSVWAFGDPGHTRVLVPEMFQFLNRGWMKKQQSKTHASDYIRFVKYDWTIDYICEVTPHTFGLALKKL